MGEVVQLDEYRGRAAVSAGEALLFELLLHARGITWRRPPRRGQLARLRARSDPLGS